MKNALKLAVAALSMSLVLGCASPEYLISTNDGTMIPTTGKPKLDEKTGMYTYKDEQGRAVTIKKEDVKQIMER